MLGPCIQKRYKISINRPIVALSPMAGVTDLPFRTLCESLGADYSITEMVASAPQLIKSNKNVSRLFFTPNNTINIAQIIGNNPNHMAYAAQHYANLGAEVIDINLGCPAKKISSKGAGSALLSDLKLTQKILEEVTRLCPVPVTVKTRLGPNSKSYTLEKIAFMAESMGIELLAVHGRTRACKFLGTASFDEIARVKSNTSLTLLFNGDIANYQQFTSIQQKTLCEGGLIGRASVGNPWLFTEIREQLDKKFHLSDKKKSQIILNHINDIHHFYGAFKGVRFARKHIRSYLSHLNLSEQFKQISHIEQPCQQIKQLTTLLENGEPIEKKRR